MIAFVFSGCPRRVKDMDNFVFLGAPNQLYQQCFQKADAVIYLPNPSKRHSKNETN
jgi:hypothetical protein